MGACRAARHCFDFSCPGRLYLRTEIDWKDSERFAVLWCYSRVLMMLLSWAISSIRKKCSFDHLALANIIWGVMKKGPTIITWWFCVTFKPAVFTFLGLMTTPSRRASSILNSKKWKNRASFTSERRPKISAYLVDPEFCSIKQYVGSIFESWYLLETLESRKIVLVNDLGIPPNVGLLACWA